METFDVILSRRSIRKYSDQAVSDNLIEALIQAAMSAPSAGNQQPWEFVVIKNREILDEIPVIHPYASMAKSAAVAILICGDTQREVHPGFWVQDCAAATQNLLLAAHSKELGAVWVGVYPRIERVEAFRKLLTIPSAITPFSLIPIGFPAEHKPPAQRFDKKRIHQDRW